MRAIFFVLNRELGQDNECDGPRTAMMRGMAKMGHTVHTSIPAEPERMLPDHDIAFVWNGDNHRGNVVTEWKKSGKPILIMERGFFDRRNYTQIDKTGFNHLASWASQVHGPCPPDGEARLLHVCPAPMPVVSRRSGYALLLLQMPGDAQLTGCEFSHPGPLLSAVEECLITGLELRVRSHPNTPWSCGTKRRGTMIDGELREALDGARFAIAINSNSGNDALEAGCPLISLGPSLYGMSGAAKTATRETLRDGLDQMFDGWTPEPAVVTNYFRWLASRQYAVPEIASGWPLKVAMRLAGVPDSEIG